MPGGDAENDDEWVHREEIAGEEGSAEDGEGDPVSEKDDGDGSKCRFADGGWAGGGDWDEENSDGTDDGDEHVHVGR